MEIRGVELRGEWTAREVTEATKILAVPPRAFIEANSGFKVLERQPVLLDAPPTAPGHSKYDPNSSSIVVYDKGVYDGDRIDPEQFRRSIYHELAHAIVRDNPAVLAEWTASTRNDGFIDDYAKTSPEEDLADTFSEFLIDAKRATRAVPIKAAFVRRMLTRASFD